MSEISFALSADTKTKYLIVWDRASSGLFYDAKRQQYCVTLFMLIDGQKHVEYSFGATADAAVNQAWQHYVTHSERGDVEWVQGVGQ